MSKQISILIKSSVIISIFISVDAEYVRHKDKVLNKGTWFKTNNEKLFDKSDFGDFIFKPNSLNVEDVFQDYFYSMGNSIQDNSFIPNFIDRPKRSPNVYKDGLGPGLNDCVGEDCNTKPASNNIPIIISKFTTKPYKNPSLLEGHKYDVALLLEKARNNNKVLLEEVMDKTTDSRSIDQINSSNETNQPNKTFEVIMAHEILNDNSDDNKTNSTPPKRSMAKNYESEVVKKIEIIEDLQNSRKYDRSIFDDKIKNFPGSGPDLNVYKIIPKPDERITVSEKGLLKLLSILSKTFKKIVKQHIEIKKIHDEMFAGKEDIDKSVTLLIKKFNDFETKYTDLKDYHEKIQQLYEKLAAKEASFKAKETEITNNLADFENQQKKFLTQQRQFYNIQKLMLSQNEKINAKQSMIAQTQGEISRRQNNFARILKKIKQVFSGGKSEKKIANISESNPKVTPLTTTPQADVAESVKIDLFSIPSTGSQQILNQDQMILKEKDENPVDDLVYKYYFNNTYIDNLMKNQILSGSLHGSKYMTRNAKVKRNERKKAKSTILIPIDNNAIDANVTESIGKTNKTRAKRWIRHHSKLRRRHHHKMTPDYEMKDEKNAYPKANGNLLEITEKVVATPTTKCAKLNTEKTGQAFVSLEKLAKSVERHLNPFTTMAANFCIQIKQNDNPQMLRWCIEKVLRKLQNIETIPVVATLQKTIPKTTKKVEDETTTTKTSAIFFSTEKSVTTPPPMPSQVAPQTATVTSRTTDRTETASTTQAVFFPDNDELESNLKQYELTTDNEGVVFDAGSLHASEVLGRGDSEGFSDILPDMDSDSRVGLDPLTFDLRTLRRASFKRMNDNMFGKKGFV